MAQDWFIVHNGKDNGPHTAAQLKEMASNGTLKPDDLVRRADMQAPTKASKIKGLFADPAPQSIPSTPSVEGKKKSGISKKTLVTAASVAGGVMFLCCISCGIVSVFNKDRKPIDNTQAKQSEPAQPVAKQTEQANKSPNLKSASNDEHVIVFDAPVKIIPVESVFDRPFQLSPDGSFLLANGSEVWNVKTSKKLQSPEHFLRSRLSPSGTRLAAIQLGNRKRLFIFSLKDDNLVVQQKIELGHRDCFGPWWSDDEKRVAVTSSGPIYASTPPEDQDGFIMTLGEGEPQVGRFKHPEAGHEIMYDPTPYFSADATSLIVTMRNKYREPNKNTSFSFDSVTGKLLDQSPKKNASTDKWELRRVPNDDGRVEVWRTGDNRLVAVLGKPDGLNRSFNTITPDGRIVASAQYQKGGVEIWDMEQGQKVSLKSYKESLASGARPDYTKIKAPPMSDAIYNQIRVRMTTIEVWKLVGGRPYDDKNVRHEEGPLKTDWIVEVVEYYHSKDHPGSRIVLSYRGKGTAPPLVNKAIVR